MVTGAASGIGRGIAEAFAAAGSRLVLADRNEERLAETGAALGGGVLAVPTDVRDPQSVATLAERAFEAFGAVHVLCNNAGVACNGLVWEHTLDDWEWVFQTNVRGTAACLRAFVPRMLEQGEPGHIVNTSSMLGLSSAPLTGIYGASKQAVVGISEALRLDLLVVGAEIGVSVLCPGPVRTNVTEEPGRPPRQDGSSVSETVAGIHASLKQVVADGMEPRLVGDCVVDAVRDGRFWILPAPEYLASAEQRLAGLRTELGLD